VKLLLKTIIIQILTVALIFIAVITVELPFAQEQTDEMTKENSVSLPEEKRSEGDRGRNPFLLPTGIYLLSKGGGSSGQKEGATKPDTKPQEIDSLRVKAILISDNIRLAQIGRHIVTVGDTINGEKVLKIKNDRVILEKGDKKRTLLLRQSPVQLTTEEKQLPLHPSPSRGEERRGVEEKERGGNP
jgi:type II secretory pathway component PulC